MTLLKPENREFGQKRTDRQLHVLPNYRAADVDEYGSQEGQIQKIKSGALEILDELVFLLILRIRAREIYCQRISDVEFYISEGSL